MGPLAPNLVEINAYQVRLLVPIILRWRGGAVHGLGKKHPKDLRGKADPFLALLLNRLIGLAPENPSHEASLLN